MRLLRHDGRGQYEFEQYIDPHNIPKYAILSHRWASDEILFEHMLNQQGHGMIGYGKIEFCGKQASKDNLHHIWIDTCCINKKDSPELQESIISMFRWYCEAAKCYVYLNDVSATEQDTGGSLESQPWKQQFWQSKWFTRGWTLQELLAPSCVEFYSREGTFLGDKSSLEQWLLGITRIPAAALRGHSPDNFTIDQRFSWAKHRQTTRPEDKAYSLMGLFNVQFVVLYGEQEGGAFKRLKEEIKKDAEERIRLNNLANDLPTSSTAEFSSTEIRRKQLCLPNTRVEVLREIEAWADELDDRHIYWLSGLAGMGKSTIARTLAKTFDAKGILGGTFFCSRGGGDAGRARRLMTTLASQMARMIPSIKPHIGQAIAEHKYIVEESLRDQWEQLIIEPLSKLRRSELRPDTIVLVIDALDECDSPADIRRILKIFANTERLKKLGLRVFITSRPEIHICAEFERIPEMRRQRYVLHEISEATVNQDLTVFFKLKFQEVKEDRGLSSDWPDSHVISWLVSISSGLFIWASTAWLWIRQYERLVKKRVNKLINGHRSEANAMKTLDEMYMTVLEDAIQPRARDEDDHDCSDPEADEDDKAEILGTFRKILGTIVVLSSPLSLDSLSSLLEVDTNTITDTLANLHAILHIPQESTQPIRLHHPTFRDFLLDSNRCTNTAFCIDEKHAQDALAANCVRLMTETLQFNICGLHSPGTLAKDIDHFLLEYSITPELQYACLHWAEHYRRAGTHLQDDDDTHEFSKKHFLNWVEIISITGKSSEMAAILRMYQSLLVVSAMLP